MAYEFLGETFTFNVPALFLLALVVGLIGGTYGIGGGAIIAPFLAAIFKLPMYTIAGGGAFRHPGNFRSRCRDLLRYRHSLPICSWGRCSA